MPVDTIQALQVCREAEREQAQFYRALAAQAEAQGDAALAQRLHDLHADEQHHLSRLTARLMELGAEPHELAGIAAPHASLRRWEDEAQRREREEIHRYEVFLAQRLDDASTALLWQILETERHHARELGGKWTPA